MAVFQSGTSIHTPLDIDLLFLKMDLQFIDIGRNIGAIDRSSQRSLRHRKHSGRQSSDTPLLKLTTGLQAFPGGRDLNADTFRVVGGREVLEYRDNS